MRLDFASLIPTSISSPHGRVLRYWLQRLEIIGREPSDILADLKWKPRLFAEKQTVEWSRMPAPTWRKLNEGVPLMRGEQAQWDSLPGYDPKPVRPNKTEWGYMDVTARHNVRKLNIEWCRRNFMERYDTSSVWSAEAY